MALEWGFSQTHWADLCRESADAAHTQLKNAQSHPGYRLLMDSECNALFATLPALGIDKPN